jgi:pimeloyl-ACP methyl ester carboxylesterase
MPALRDFPPSDRSPSRIIGGELLAFAASSVLYPFGIRATRARTARRREQRTVVLVHGYLGNRSSFYPLSLYLKARGFDLVCHSLGGVIACMYLQMLGGARRVDRCITLGTPHRGTYNAYWLLSRVGRELRPDSRLLERLESTRGAASAVRFSSIVAGSDNIVIPRVFSAMDEDVVQVPDLGHLGLLFSPTVFRAVHERLSRS